MMLRRAFLTAGLAGSVALGALLAPGLASAQEPITLRVHQFLGPNGTVPRDFIIPWAEKVTEESEGRLNVEVYSSMSLGGTPAALYDQVREGVVDIIWTVAGYTPGRFPISETFELPFMMADAESTSRAAWRFHEEYMQEETEDVHMLAVHVHGPGIFHMRAPAIERIEDVEGRTVRGPTRITTRLLETLGATAVGMPVPQVPEALSRNVIEGAVIPWEVTQVLRVPELVDTHTEFGGDRGLYSTFFFFAMNRDSYDALPEDLQEIIDANSGIEASAWAGRIQEAGDAPGREAAVERGNTIVTIEGEELARWREAAQQVRDDWAEEMEEEGVDGAALIEAAEDLIAEEESR
ncbi:MAG: TRAP-type C4-dicarboxylate transport system, periplasmic component [Rhodobacteraceae bacterium HLUCCA12]|nr:MAG: TRAP-type C4-dicarboxylate transport system, periplasmic component [Rhodobacteraceae bacterium HLUCCA12]